MEAQEASGAMARDERIGECLNYVRAAADAFLLASHVHCHSLHDIAAAVHTLCARIAKAESAGADRESIRDAASVARLIHARSRFVARLQTWPRGYPGDFETMEYLLRQQVSGNPSTIEYWLEYLALNSPVAQQHRNRVLAQARQITGTVGSRNNPSILMLAAGSGPDLRLAKDAVRERSFHAVLNDFDSNALQAALEGLPEIQDRIATVRGNVFTSIPQLSAHGPFDLILAGGLFDYLNDRQAAFLLRGIWALLKPGGRFFLTNIRRANPYRVWMEYLADWKLAERSEEDLKALVARGVGAEATCDVATDGTRLACLVTIERR